ncbi:YkvA family protein [Virgibacillus oceani]|uniref:DUF1232 domain-containing protein n=1 Tax=Virgibacillus oceani TaxID=1479511 RepID=A0A917M5U4_9BACI|nr:YkvA family protein [Virgibacillus oceani]GGG79158.1 hypothetical protein GCM10011398_25600 [Virgibacillus oceani]
MFKKMKCLAKKLKQQIFILYYACKDDRLPWYAKVFIAFVVAYAFSPIDLIPDFIPVLGYLDEVILLPLGIMLALKMIPKDILSDCKIKAEKEKQNDKPKNWIVGSIIVLIWGVFAGWIVMKIYQHFK